MPALMYRARRLDDEAHLVRLKKEAKVGHVTRGGQGGWALVMDRWRKVNSMRAEERFSCLLRVIGEARGGGSDRSVAIMLR
jgi:hypothetical protein